MDLYIGWQRPLSLRKSRNDQMIYVFDYTKVGHVAGVYIFGRRFGRSFEALYVGKARSLRSRVKDHHNNLRLMKHLEKAPIGKRILLAGRLKAKPGQRQEKCLKIIESTLIRPLPG
jgi:hypothetical protein